MNEISLGIIFGLLVLLGFGFKNALAPKVVKKLGNTETLFWNGLFIVFFLGLVVFAFRDQVVWDVKYLLIAVGLGILGFVPVLSFYKGLKTGKSGIIIPIGTSYMVFTTLFAVLLFGEKLSPLKIVLIGVIFVGIILSSINFKDFKNSSLFDKSSGIIFAIIACLLRGLVFALWKYPVTVLGPILTAFIVEGMTMVLAGSSLKIRGKKFQKPDKKTLFLLFLMGITGTAGTLFYNLGINVADISLIAVLSAGSPVIGLLYSKFVYKEKLQIQQWIAIVLILVGVISMGALGS